MWNEFTSVRLAMRLTASLATFSRDFCDFWRQLQKPKSNSGTQELRVKAGVHHGQVVLSDLRIKY